MLLNNAEICLNIPETEPKITYKSRNIYSHIGVLKILPKWSRRERLTKTNYSLQLFPKCIDRDVNTAQHFINLVFRLRQKLIILYLYF